jgi:hypothetical protein
MQRIAITGGVAEGKTTVLRIFESLGAQAISSDQLAATLLLPGTEVWEQLIREFGQAIIAADGALARERLATLAFGDAAVRRRLNRIMHPAVVQHAAGATAGARAVADAHLRRGTAADRGRAARRIRRSGGGAGDACAATPATAGARSLVAASASNPARATAHAMQNGLRRLGDSHPRLAGTGRGAGAPYLAHAHAAGILGSATEFGFGRQNRAGVSRVIRNLTTEEEVRTQ